MIEIGIGRARNPQSGRVAVVDDQVFDLATSLIFLGPTDAPAPELLSDVLLDWERWSDRLLAIRDLVRADRERIPSLGSLSDVTLDAPVVPDALLLFAAANYAEHTIEAENSDWVGTKVGSGATDPYMFLKPNRSVVGPTDPILSPSDALMVDWEVELGVVIAIASRPIRLWTTWPATRFATMCPPETTSSERSGPSSLRIGLRRRVMTPSPRLVP